LKTLSAWSTPVSRLSTSNPMLLNFFPATPRVTTHMVSIALRARIALPSLVKTRHCMKILLMLSLSASSCSSLVTAKHCPRKAALTLSRNTSSQNDSRPMDGSSPYFFATSAWPFQPARRRETYDKKRLVHLHKLFLERKLGSTRRAQQHLRLLFERKVLFAHHPALAILKPAHSELKMWPFFGMLPPAASSVLRPLQGVTVVALEQAVSAPLCTRHLADMGARVIKIERLGEGDYLRTLDWSMKGMCSHFVWANRGKESVTLDVKKPEGLQIMNQLLEKADVYVQNLAPGATERLGLDAAAVRKRHPSLVCATIAGYGANGPYETKKAYDMLIQAEAGLLDVTGTADTPAKVGTPVADIASAMYAYSGVLAALFRRATQPGKPGADIEVSMLDALGDWMGWVLAQIKCNVDEFCCDIDLLLLTAHGEEDGTARRHARGYPTVRPVRRGCQAGKDHARCSKQPRVAGLLRLCPQAS